MDTINRDFKHARRRARRYEHPHLDYPTYARKGLTPKVRIGSQRDPALPIEIFPAIHTPPARKRMQWRNSALWAASCVAVVASFAFVRW